MIDSREFLIIREDTESILHEDIGIPVSMENHIYLDRCPEIGIDLDTIDVFFRPVIFLEAREIIIQEELRISIFLQARLLSCLDLMSEELHRLNEKCPTSRRWVDEIWKAFFGVDEIYRESIVLESIEDKLDNIAWRKELPLVLFETVTNNTLEKLS